LTSVDPNNSENTKNIYLEIKKLLKPKKVSETFLLRDEI